MFERYTKSSFAHGKTQSLQASANRFSKGCFFLFSLLVAQNVYGQAAFLESSQQRLAIAASPDRAVGRYHKELLELQQKHFADDDAHRSAVRDWMKEKGASLQAERERRFSKRKAGPEAETIMKLFHAVKMSRRQSDGRIGPKKSQLIALLDQDFESASARKVALGEWLEANREALKAERTFRASQRTLSQRTPFVPVRAVNKSSSKVDLMAIREAEYANPDERRAAMREWVKANRAAQRAEAEIRLRY